MACGGVGVCLGRHQAGSDLVQLGPGGGHLLLGQVVLGGQDIEDVGLGHDLAFQLVGPGDVRG